jgi:diguanylate cyclase (GGDEF)-like protein
MELMVGVLLAGAVVNVTLLAWMSRAAHIRLHWPARLQAAFRYVGAHGPIDRDPLAGRRPVYGPGARLPAGRAVYRTTGSQFARGPVSATLPPDLAAFLSKPAPIHAGLDADSARSDPWIKAGSANSPVDGTGESGLGLDALTGLEGPAGWSRIVAIENARLLRYRRPVTVVLAEVEGLRRLAERLGEEPVERLLPVVADAFRREARDSDWVARVGKTRFAALLAETDEIQAINYVERIRLVCEPWLSAVAVPLRLAIGWSGPTASSDLEFAVACAEERMHDDRRLPSLAPALPLAMAAVSPAETGRPAAEEAVLAGTTPNGREPSRAVKGKGRRPRQGPATASDGGHSA